jgi:sulfoxide reductase heme-binding subunit YedZ
MATARSSTAPRTALALAGWPIVGWSALIVAALSTAALVTAGGGETGWRAVVRLTARTSFVLFSAAFIASSLRALWPAPSTRWLLANRRYVGVSFAASHAMHLLAIVAVARVAADFRAGPATLVGAASPTSFSRP